MSKGNRSAIQADDDVTAAGRSRELKGCIRNSEGPLGHRTMEAEISREVHLIVAVHPTKPKLQ